jgi:hypothetical protein
VVGVTSLVVVYPSGELLSGFGTAAGARCPFRSSVVVDGRYIAVFHVSTSPVPTISIVAVRLALNPVESVYCGFVTEYRIRKLEYRAHNETDRAPNGRHR